MCGFVEGRTRRHRATQNERCRRGFGGSPRAESSKRTVERGHVFENGRRRTTPHLGGREKEEIVKGKKRKPALLSTSLSPGSSVALSGTPMSRAGRPFPLGSLASQPVPLRRKPGWFPRPRTSVVSTPACTSEEFIPVSLSATGPGRRCYKNWERARHREPGGADPPTQRFGTQRIEKK